MMLSQNFSGLSDIPRFFSQSGQDKILYDRFFEGFKKGVFVDIVAYNGFQFSNTFFFEAVLSWTGICIEPNPIQFRDLKKNRRCTCIEGCISDSTEDALFYGIVGGNRNVDMYSGLERHYSSSHYKTMQAALKKEGGEIGNLCEVLPLE